MHILAACAPRHTHTAPAAGLDQLPGQGLRQGAQALSSTLRAAQRNPEAVLQELNSAAQQGMGLARTVAQAGMQQAEVSMQLHHPDRWLSMVAAGTSGNFALHAAPQQAPQQAHVGCRQEQSRLR